MSDAKFTPGPWRVCTTGNMSNVVEGVAGKTDDYDDGFRSVALVQACSAERDHIKRDVNRDANMALIAAAPDLYEALTAYVEDCDNHECEFCIRARAALAKARGET